MSEVESWGLTWRGVRQTGELELSAKGGKLQCKVQW